MLKSEMYLEPRGMGTKTPLRFVRILFESTTSRLQGLGFSVGYSYQSKPKPHHSFDCTS